jgi:hypothetical protein
VARARYLLASSLALLLALGAYVPAAAGASQTAKLSVGFRPYHLGSGTSVEFNAQISTTSGGVPSPLSELDMQYPSTLGFAVSGLGLATCSKARLEAGGPAGCPVNSHMGRGTVRVAIPFGPEVIHEEATVSIVRAPEEGSVALLFFAEGENPVSADIPFTGLLAEAALDSEKILVSVPLVQGLPGGPDVAVVQLHATFGPLGLTYYERVRGKLVAYRPRGVLLPNRCKAGGFRFSADFVFLDGTRTTAKTAVPCPSAGRRGRAQR